MLDRFLRRDENDQIDHPRAVCALLVAAARADGVFEADEARAVVRLVAEQFGLEPEETAALVTAAAGEDQLDLYPVTRWFMDNLSATDRADVVGRMWKVMYSDGRLEAHEDALMHRVGKLLHLQHRDLMALKLAARPR